MSETLERVKRLVAAGSYRISDHGYEQLEEDDILASEVVDGLKSARIVEDYPDYWKGPCVLVLETLASGRVVHALWGTSLRDRQTAVLITGYSPDPNEWSPDYLSRKKR